MTSIKHIVFIVTGIFVIGTGTALAEPAINSVSGAFTHKGTIVIRGFGFGEKDPAAPLMWDDCEDRAVDNDSAVTSAGWVDVWPQIRVADYAAARTRYRNIPYRSTPAPHPNSTKYLAGCHYQYADNNPQFIGDPSDDQSYRSVCITADNGSAANNWYVSFYYTLDPNWNKSGLNYNNHKLTVNQKSGQSYTGGMQYNAYCGSNGPAPRAGNDICRIEGHSSNNELGNCTVSALNTNNPADHWIKVEDYVATKRHMYIDNVHAFRDDPISDIRSFSLGGYYRRVRDGGTIANTADYRGGVGASNYRYFDDMYIDTTLSRVILTNNSTYSSATIIEPQIPSAWANNSITITVNQAKFADCETAYLFVFDADNNHNAVGYPIRLVTGAGKAPCPPIGGKLFK